MKKNTEQLDYQNEELKEEETSQRVLNKLRTMIVRMHPYFSELGTVWLCNKQLLSENYSERKIGIIVFSQQETEVQNYIAKVLQKVFGQTSQLIRLEWDKLPGDGPELTRVALVFHEDTAEYLLNRLNDISRSRKSK